MVGVVTTLVTGLIGACSEGGTRPVRVVLITLDTLRYDCLPVEGSPLMPKSTAFADQGLRFENFYSATSTTQPTHATLFTGLHPWQTGVPRNGAILSEEHVTLAERFQAVGFHTAATVASFPLHSKFGFAQGFEDYGDDFQRRLALAEWEGQAVEQNRFYSLAKTVADQAIAQIDNAEGDRQFFWFHFFDAHDPYGDSGSEVLPIPELIGLAARKDPRLPERIQRARALYDRDVGSMDQALARIYRRLEQDRDRYVTHVVLTADHGESFGEARSLGHGRRVTREQVHVPLVIVSPRVTPSVRTDLAGSVDLPQTLLALAGVNPTLGTGRNLLKEHDAPLAVGMRRTYAQPHADMRTDGEVVSIDGAWFFGVRDGHLYAGNSEQVVEEDNPDRPAAPQVAQELRSLFSVFERSLAGSDFQESMDPEDLEALRHLGYVR